MRKGHWLDVLNGAISGFRGNVLVRVGADRRAAGGVSGTVLSFELELLWPKFTARLAALLWTGRFCATFHSKADFTFRRPNVKSGYDRKADLV